MLRAVSVGLAQLLIESVKLLFQPGALRDQHFDSTGALFAHCHCLRHPLRALHQRALNRLALLFAAADFSLQVTGAGRQFKHVGTLRLEGVVQHSLPAKGLAKAVVRVGDGALHEREVLADKRRDIAETKGAHEQLRLHGGGARVVGGSGGAGGRAT